MIGFTSPDRSPERMPSTRCARREAMSRDADIRGVALPNTTPGEKASIHGALVAGLENGTLRPVIGKELPLAEAPQAHRAVIEPGAFGKIVLVPAEESVES